MERNMPLIEEVIAICSLLFSKLKQIKVLLHLLIKLAQTQKNSFFIVNKMIKGIKEELKQNKQQ
jgi:hypothetical protein